MRVWRGRLVFGRVLHAHPSHRSKMGIGGQFKRSVVVFNQRSGLNGGSEIFGDRRAAELHGQEFFR